MSDDYRLKRNERPESVFISKSNRSEQYKRGGFSSLANSFFNDAPQTSMVSENLGYKNGSQVGLLSGSLQLSSASFQYRIHRKYSGPADPWLNKRIISLSVGLLSGAYCFIDIDLQIILPKRHMYHNYASTLWTIRGCVRWSPFIKDMGMARPASA